MAKSMEQVVTELADREAIRALPQHYCDCVWHNNIEGLVSLFAEDGAFITRGRQREHKVAGRPELLKMYGTLTSADVMPRPYIHNHVIELKDDGRASGRCYVELRDANRDFEWVGTGFYNDEYVKQGEHWKFQSRTFTIAHMQRMPGRRA